MTPSEEKGRYAKIDATLGALIAELPAEPSWLTRWQDLSADSTMAERLSVYQAIRDSAILPEDAGFYLVSWLIDELSCDDGDSALAEIDSRLSAIEQEHGLGEDEIWDPSEAPAEYQALIGQQNDAWDALLAKLLESHGEIQAAELFRNDRAEYERRSESGREFFFGPRLEDEVDETEWLGALLEAVAESLTAESPMGPLGMRYGVDEDFWEVVVYPTPVELVGGAEDGAVVTPYFSLDFEQLRSSFERIDASGWCALGWPIDDGPYVWLEGDFRGRDVWLKVLAEAPDGEAPGAKMAATPRGFA